MADQKKNKPSQETPPPPGGETNNPDFQFVLNALLATYEPILEQQLHLVRNPQDLQKQIQAGQQSCAEEFARLSLSLKSSLPRMLLSGCCPPRRESSSDPSTNGVGAFCIFVAASYSDGWSAVGRTFRGFAYYL